MCFLLCISNFAKAQFDPCHEIGLIVGPVAFKSDYGARNNSSTNFGNTGFGVGIVHFLDFSYSKNFSPKTYFKEHFKIRTELSFNKTQLDHSGQWIEGNPSIGKEQLKAMKGSTSAGNIGMQIEFFPLNLHDFSSTTGRFAPFIGLGGQFSVYNSKAWSTLGPLGNSLTTFPKYLTPTDNRPFGFSSESKSTWSIVSSIGTRYKLSYNSDLMLDLRSQYYFSDWVDGLKPNPAIYTENQSNDWLIWLNVGYIYYID